MGPTKDICQVILGAIEQSCDAAFMTDPDGVIIYANPAFEKLNGYKLPEIIGKKPNILKSGEHGPEFYKEMWAALKAGRHWEGRITNRCKDGSKYTEELHICPVTAGDGKIKYFFATIRDITAELELENQLRQSQKMEALGLLSGQLSHDFNNLLTIIIGSIEVVLEDAPKNEVSKTLLEGILRNSRQYATLIKQLLIFARKHESRIEAVDLNQLLTDIRPLAKTMLSAGINLDYKLAGELKAAKSDPEQLKQVIINMLINAKDAMEHGGTVTIKTENIEDSETPPRASKPGPRVLLTISDTGSGIAPHIIEHIFEPFFTTKAKNKGTGLGLSTAYGIIESHGGHIAVESEPGRGTTFRIYLPAA